jgi:hypothetical protein
LYGAFVVKGSPQRLIIFSSSVSFFDLEAGNAHSVNLARRKLQGRVFSICRLIAWTILPVSTAAGGVLAGITDPDTSFPRAA